MYGLRDSPHFWHKKLKTTLLSLGFKCFVLDSCVFVHHNLWVVTYVDDLLYFSNDEAILDSFEKLLEEEFNLRKSDDVRKYVGFELKTFDNGSVKLHCEGMISALAKKFQMDKCKFRDIPIAAGTQMIETTDVPLDNRTEYLSLVGSLVYIANLARPDISFSVHLLAKQNAKPSKRHMSIARDVLGYLWHSRSKGLVFHRGQLVNGGEDKKKLSLIGCSDADYANDRSNCKSVSGGVIFLEGMIVDYFCKKQAHVSRSTMEAEFIALSALTEKLLF